MQALSGTVGRRAQSCAVVRRVAACLFGVVLGSACIGMLGTPPAVGSERGTVRRASAVASRGDTVRVKVHGTIVIVPAPDGMADVLSSAGLPPRKVEDGETVWGAFQRRDRVGDVLRHGLHTGLVVMLSLSRESSGPAPADPGRFAALCADARVLASRSGSREGARVAEALRRWRSGARRDNPKLGNVPDGPGYVVAFERLQPCIFRILTLMHSTDRHADAVEVWCETRVLVRGRILTLNWSSYSAATVGDLAAVCDASERWARAILAANP